MIHRPAQEIIEENPMPSIDEMAREFGQKLNSQREKHQRETDIQIQQMRENFMKRVKPVSPDQFSRQMKELDRSLFLHQGSANRPSTQALVNLTGCDPLQQMDRGFTQHFQLDRYFSTRALAYPTILCGTLEEFYSTELFHQNISDFSRQQLLQNKVLEAQALADQSGGKSGTFGINIPGRGCYLNGWLFNYGRSTPVDAMLEDPQILPLILMTAVHEKLGHGFLSSFSTFGKARTHLDLDLIGTAEKFGSHPSDNPTDSLRLSQYAIISQVSQVFEEGWATWIETYLGNRIWDRKHPIYSPELIAEAIQNITLAAPDLQDVQNVLMAALIVLFSAEPADAETVFGAIRVVETLGYHLDEYFSAAISQPLRYAIGELLCTVIEIKQGVLCVPYAVLTAGNVDISPASLSLNDLRVLLTGDYRLSPDARLALISKLTAGTEKNDVSDLAQRIESQLSFSIPPELK
jgi:hypothetical protein